MYDQLVTPNLNAAGQVGYCLAFAETVFGTPHLYGTATEAWNATQYRHLDQNFPANAAVLLWWSYTLNGVDYGHVAVNVPGRGILSSPWQSGTTHAWLPSIAELERIYSNNGQHPLIYRGWSEDIANVRVAQPQGEDMAEKITLDTAHVLTWGILGRNGLVDRPYSLDGSCDQDLLAHHVGQDLTNEYVIGLFQSGESTGWRDGNAPDTIHGIAASLASIPQLQATIAKLNDTVNQITSDDSAEKEQLQNALLKVADLTKQLQAASKPVTPPAPAPAPQPSGFLAWVKKVLHL